MDLRWPPDRHRDLSNSTKTVAAPQLILATRFEVTPLRPRLDSESHQTRKGAAKVCHEAGLVLGVDLHPLPHGVVLLCVPRCVALCCVVLCYVALCCVALCYAV